MNLTFHATSAKALAYRPKTIEQMQADDILRELTEKHAAAKGLTVAEYLARIRAEASKLQTIWCDACGGTGCGVFQFTTCYQCGGEGGL